MSDAVITQDILADKSEKPVRTTSEDIKSEMADLYHSHGRIRFPAYLAD
jgi:hypothetical protein